MKIFVDDVFIFIIIISSLLFVSPFGRFCTHSVSTSSVGTAVVSDGRHRMSALYCAESIYRRRYMPFIQCFSDHRERYHLQPEFARLINYCEARASARASRDHLPQRAFCPWLMARARICVKNVCIMAPTSPW